MIFVSSRGGTRRHYQSVCANIPDVHLVVGNNDHLSSLYRYNGEDAISNTWSVCLSPCPIILYYPLQSGVSDFCPVGRFQAHLKLRQGATRGAKENLKHASRSSLASVRAHEWLFQRPLLHVSIVVPMPSVSTKKDSGRPTSG